MRTLVAPPESPEEGDLVKDGLTGKNMFYRFGKWREVSDEEVEIIESMRK